MREALNDLRKKLGQCDHPGLLMDRYFPGTQDAESGEAKARHFQTIISSSKRDDAETFYKAYFARWKGNPPSAKCERADLTTVGHIVLGLGRPSVMEVGIHLHHSLGFPYIPGSSLKGACAHYCARVWGAGEERFRSKHPEGEPKKTSGNYHEFLFGTTEQAGAIGFEDAWWVPGNRDPFHSEVMTPHHKEWQDGGKAPPTDFDSPVPVSFLSFSGTFHFRLFWQGPEPDNEMETVAMVQWLKLAMELLRETLAESGVGGKTSSGFGRFDNKLKAFQGNPNEGVSCILLEEKTKKGGWRAQIKGYLQSGPIQNSDKVPTDKNAGDEVFLVISSINASEVALKWPNN